MSASLHALAPDLWVASRPLRLWIGDIGCRMTVIRLADGGLFLHSPVPLDDAIRAALDRLGPVRWIVGPSKVHHFYLGDYARAYPAAQLCAAPGLPDKRSDLRFQQVLGDAQPPPWGAEIRTQLFRGAPLMNEVVFLHAASRTLLLTDLAFNVDAGGGAWPGTSSASSSVTATCSRPADAPRWRRPSPGCAARASRPTTPGGGAAPSARGRARAAARCSAPAPPPRSCW